jgi:hypothetical protein
MIQAITNDHSFTPKRRPNQIGVIPTVYVIDQREMDYGAALFYLTNNVGFTYAEAKRYLDQLSHHFQ